MGMDKAIEKKKWPPKRIATYAGIGIAAIVITYLVNATTGNSRLNVNAEQLTISEITQGEFQELIAVQGSVMPVNTTYLDAEEGGRVDKIFRKAGSMVKEGHPILMLTNTNLLMDIMYREAELFQQSNNLRNTRLSFEQSRLSLKNQLNEINYRLNVIKRKLQRKKALFDKKTISPEEYNDIEDEYDYLIERKTITEETIEADNLLRNEQVVQLEESLRRMHENLEIVKNKLANLTVKAPISGQLTSLDAQLGQSIAPGQRLGQIDEIGSFKVRVEVDEHYINRITSECIGRCEIGNDTYMLAAIQVFPEVLDGEFEIDMVFEDEMPENLRRGQTLHIKLELGDVYKTVLIERGGFYQTTGGNWVFVVDDSGKYASRRGVLLGRYNPDYYEVVEGLNPGEKVITSSYDSFGDFETLRLQ